LSYALLNRKSAKSRYGSPIDHFESMKLSARTMSNPQKGFLCSKRNLRSHLEGFLRGILILEALPARSSASVLSRP
jgi:hypothetical protein